MNQITMANPLNAFVQGMGQADTAAQFRDRRQLNALLPQYGVGAMGGQQNAINALLGAGGAGLEAVNRLRGLGRADEEGQRAERRLDMDRERLDMEAQELRQQAAEAARAAAAEGRAAEVEAETTALRGLLTQFEVARRSDNLDGFIMQNAQEFEALGIDPREAMDDPDGWLAGALALHDGMTEGVMGIADALVPMEAQADPTSAQRNYEFLVGQGVAPEEARNRAFSGGVTVNTGDTGADIGTIPPGFSAVRDPSNPSGYRMFPIPGGEAASEAASAQGQNEMVAAAAQDSISLVDAVLNSPDLSAVTGMVQGRLPPRSQSQQDLMVRIEQLQGQAFMQAFESLKGGGQITDREGEAARSAIARLQRVQSEEAFRQGLLDLRAIMERARRRSMGENIPDMGDVPPPSGGGSGFTPIPDAGAQQPAPQQEAGRGNSNVAEAARQIQSAQSVADLARIPIATLGPENAAAWNRRFEELSRDDG